MSAADGDAAVGDAAVGDAAVGDAAVADAGPSGTSIMTNSSKVKSSSRTGLNGGLIMVLTLAGLNVVLTPLVDGSGAGAVDDGLGGVSMVDAVGSFIPWKISCRPFKYFDAWSASSWLLKSSLRKIRLMLANAFKASRFL